MKVKALHLIPIYFDVFIRVRLAINDGLTLSWVEHACTYWFVLILKEIFRHEKVLFLLFRAEIFRWPRSSQSECILLSARMECARNLKFGMLVATNKRCKKIIPSKQWLPRVCVKILKILSCYK